MLFRSVLGGSPSPAATAPPKCSWGFRAATAITLLGLILGIRGILDLSPWLLVASMACDVADGFTARVFEGETNFGNRLDWLTDCALCHMALWKMGLPWASFIVVIFQAFSDTRNIHASGRAAAFCLLLFQITYQ